MRLEEMVACPVTETEAMTRAEKEEVNATVSKMPPVPPVPSGKTI
jgi:hypothetical protein